MHTTQHAQVSRFRRAGDHVTPLDLRDILDRTLRNPKKNYNFFSGLATPRRSYFKANQVDQVSPDQNLINFSVAL